MSRPQEPRAGGSAAPGAAAAGVDGAGAAGAAAVASATAAAAAGPASGAAGGSDGFHCAYCLAALEVPSTCSACKRRSYCSRACQRADWLPGAAGGQGHKHWCALGCGEEGREWAVRLVGAGRGRGVVALADMAAGFRVLVDAALPLGHPCLAAPAGARRAAALQLHPEEAGLGLEAKFEKNEYGSHEGPVVGLRLSRVNHGCDPNAAKVHDYEFGVNVVVALRRIRAGEEVLIAYLPADDPSEERGADEGRAILAGKWGVACPADCRCRDEALAERMEHARELDARIFALGGRCDVAGAVAAAEELLALYDAAGLSPLHMARARTLFDAFQVSVMQRARAAQAAAFLRRALAVHEQVYHPTNRSVTEYRDLASNPAKHKNFGVAD